MSGGFFRGTSADQDTRFSNKQAKLLKSQKFAPELEHLVDMTKVKMDVMRPWIAKRVTELVGIEDEVLINFIYSLLEGKGINGKEVQIQLTGFMERNTGKFMKELWSLLLSAQNNASGVPQQFLDAKEEEAKKKKAEADRITSEIQRRKDREYQELQQEKKKADGDVDISRDTYAALEPSSKHHTRGSPMPSAEKEYADKNGSRGRNRTSRSPHSADHSPVPSDRRSRSVSRSFSNSRSYSGGRRRSRSRSSPEQRRRSISSERANLSPVKRSITPRHKHSPRRSVSPPRQRRRSVSRSRRRSPSPMRYRRHSPLRRRSRSLIRRRSRSPMWRRSRSPIRRSPVRYRSRSPLRRRSPSPIRRRTPSYIRHRSPSPFKRRSRHSPLSPRRCSPSTVRRPVSGRRVSRSPIRRRSRSPIRKRSGSPEYLNSASPVHHRSLSPIKKRTPKCERMSPVHSPQGRMRSRGKYSPTHSSEDGEQPTMVRKSEIAGRRLPISSRSPRSDLYDRKHSRHKRSPSPRRSPSFSESPPRRPPSVSESPRRSPPVSDSRRRRSPSMSESPPAPRERSPSEERSRSPRKITLNERREKIIRSGSPSPSRKQREHKSHHDVSERSLDERQTNSSRAPAEWKHRSLEKVHSPPEKLATHRSDETRSYSNGSGSRKRNEALRSEKASGRMDHIKDLDDRQGSSSHLAKKDKESFGLESPKADEKNHSRLSAIPEEDLPVETETLHESSRKVEETEQVIYKGSGPEESDKRRSRIKEKRKHKRSARHDSTSDDDSSCDSDVDERREAKRRKKEEKRLRKEEKRRRREERRRRREERRAVKHKLKSDNTISSPSDAEKTNDGNVSDEEHVRKDIHGREVEETDSAKKLEIELREKALESLRAKKGIGH